MRNNIFLKGAGFLACLLLVACSSTQSEPDQVETRVMSTAARTPITEVATATAIASPTATLTSVPSPTPTTANATATATPTVLVATPTDRPLPTATAEIVLPGITLTTEDFPSGFESLPFNITEDEVGFLIDQPFGFSGNNNADLVLGFTVLLPTKFEQDGFDAAMINDDFMESFVNGFWAGTNAEVAPLEQTLLSDLQDIGDTAAGLEAQVEVDGEEIQMSVLPFRRHSTGVVIMIVQPGGAGSELIKRIAKTLDERIVSVVGLNLQTAENLV
jgi:hypothetical protein